MKGKLNERGHSVKDKDKLLKAIKSNELRKIEKTFKYIYDKYSPLMVFVAAKYISEPEDIKDIVQDTFIAFFNNIENINTNIKSYLCSICKNMSLNFLKKNDKIDILNIEEIDYFANQNYDESNIHNETFKTLIEDMKIYLSELEIKIILSHLIDGYMFNEIAIKTDMNISTVKSIYYRALKKHQKRKGI